MLAVALLLLSSLQFSRGTLTACPIGAPDKSTTFYQEEAVLSGGWDHVCFLTVGGSATCFGDGVPRLSKRENQLQQLSFFRCCTDTYGQLQPTGTDYATISAGGNFACGILRNGYPSCWCAATCTPTTNSPLIRRDRQGQQLEQPGVGHAHHSARHHRCRLVPRNVDFGARARCAHLLGSGVRNHPHWLTVVLVSDLLSLPLLTCSHTLLHAVCRGYNNLGQATPPTLSAGQYWVTISAGETHTWCVLLVEIALNS